MLEAELSDSLSYDKNDSQKKQTSNRCNGNSKKTVRSEYGDMEIDIPRDREGEFEPVIVPKYQKSVNGIEEQILALYAKGISTRDIQDHLNQLYGIKVSPAFIYNVTNKIMPLIKEWQARPLQNTYAIVFLDAIQYKVRQEGHIVNKAAYMCIGVDLEGNKDVLGMWIGETESSKFWLSVLNDLRNRGVQDILIFSVDNLAGFTEAIAACYPDAEIQKCIVHQIRNLIKYVSYKDAKKITAALKPNYTAPSECAGAAELDAFEQIWGSKYPLIVQSWRKNWPE